MRYDFIHIDVVFFIFNIDVFFKLIHPSSQILFLLLLCLSLHKLKFWTGIRQKIRCGMVLVGMDSEEE